MPRHASVRIDFDAIAANVTALADLARPAALCTVVKADGYGHGAVGVARAALGAGSDWLAVALVEEGVELRDAGIDAPVLILSEPPPDAMADALAARLTPTLYTPEGIDAAATAAGAAGSDGAWTVHLKVDTGMHRVGAQPADVVGLARRIAASGLRLGGTSTHLAVADEPDRPETAVQLARFDATLGDLVAAGIDPGLVHAANSAGLLAHPAARHDLVRVGIATYGIAPHPGLAIPVTLRPALSVRAEVTLVKEVAAGEGVSYGWRHVFGRDAIVATVPLGYADGVPRRLGTTGGEVLIGGVRRPVRGVVTMDQLVVEVTDGPPVAVGDEVVLLGRQGQEQVTANEWAARLNTIAYEVVCGFGPRLPRRPA
jgi:alanine racemase